MPDNNYIEGTYDREGVPHDPQLAHVLAAQKMELLKSSNLAASFTKYSISTTSISPFPGIFGMDQLAK